MLKSRVVSGRCALLPAVSLLMAAAVAPAFAQPGNTSPDRFGDRQIGSWGDPAQGHFGNPAVGDFDNAKIIEPRPGTKPLGKLHSGKPPQASPYISLPTPADAMPADTESGSKVAAKKKPAKKRAAK